MTDTGTMPDHTQGNISVGTQKRLRTANVEVQTLYTGTIVSILRGKVYYSGGVILFFNGR
jgi:hypothetical protein